MKNKIGYGVVLLLLSSTEAFSLSFTCENISNGFDYKIGQTIPAGKQCVGYVRDETLIKKECCEGTARLYYDQAKACGYNVGSTPSLGSIMVIDSWKANSKLGFKYDNPAGHVGIVIGIDLKNQRIKLRHGNWKKIKGVPIVSEDWVSTKLPVKGYIYCEGDACGPGGPTQPTPDDPPASGKLPDFITSRVAMAAHIAKAV